MSAVSPAFPAGFLWGCSTAAHQVEGQNFANDWWDWEQTRGNIKNGDSSRLACDWWGGRYHADFENAAGLGLNALRLSLEWSRLEPRPGAWDAAAAQVYRAMLLRLRALGLRPFVTLHHFTNPRWFAAQGGWENRAAPAQFARFAANAAREFGDLCDLWATINEPNAYAALGYTAAIWPPQKRNVRAALAVVTQMLRAHAAAYHALKDVQPASEVGLAHHMRLFVPHRPASRLDRLTASLRDRVFNWASLEALHTGRLPIPGLGSLKVDGLRGAQDFIGVNYFFSEDTIFELSRPHELFGKTVVTPEMRHRESIFAGVGNPNPAGLESVLRRLAAYGKPIYVTENGVFAAAHGQAQAQYLLAHVAAVGRALAGGVPVRGYFWWSLMDNFEWSEGYSPRFGLYHVDHESQQRTARPAAAAYARLIAQGGVTARDD